MIKSSESTSNDFRGNKFVIFTDQTDSREVLRVTETVLDEEVQSDAVESIAGERVDDAGDAELQQSPAADAVRGLAENLSIRQN